MKLQDLLAGVAVVAHKGDLSVEITDVTCDSRACHEGSLFVAIPGFAADGVSFADAAKKKGARAIVAQRLVEIDGLTSLQVDDARASLAVVAANFFGRPAEKLAIVGVTGTSGKTTTTKMLESILDATNEPVGLIGTIEYRAGDEREIADRTTPDAVVLQHWFAKMVAAGVKHTVMEVSSHALALRRTHAVPFRAAIFTNLSRDHFDFHTDFEDYFAAKKMLFDQIDRSKRSAIVNIDDEYGGRLARELGSAVLSFGRSEKADVRPAKGFSVSIEGLSGDIETPSGRIRLASPLLGVPNLYNWLGAIGAAVAIGVDREAIEAGARNLGSVRGRFERVAGADGLSVLIDYAHKPDALEKLLNAVREMAAGRKITVVFGCGGDRDQGKRPLMGEIAGRLADHAVITSDNPRTEDPAEIISQIVHGIEKVDGASWTVIEDRRQAIESAVREASADSVVIVAGKGHESYQVVGDRILHFDDREEVEQALQLRDEKR